MCLINELFVIFSLINEMGISSILQIFKSSTVLFSDYLFVRNSR